MSVIIPTYNGRAQLAECLTALKAQTVPPDEIVVVENGSTDGTAAFVSAEFPSVRLLRLDRNCGYAEANNLGVRAARGELLLFLNNDAAPEPTCLATLRQAFQAAPTAGVCFAKIRLRHDRARLDVIGSSLTWTGFLHHVGFLEEDRGQYDTLPTIFSPKGVCFLMSRESFEAAGGFDDRFFAYFDETDLFWRARLAGYGIQFVPQAIVYHAVGGTSGAFHSAFIEFHAYKNRIRALLKNLGTARLTAVLPIHALCCVVITLGYLLRLRPVNAVAVIGAWGWNLVALPGTLRRRWRVQRQVRRVTDTVLFTSSWVHPSWQDIRLGLRLIFFRRGLWEQYRGTTQLPEGLH